MSYADREMVASGFTLAVVAIFIGGVVRFTHPGALDHFVGYALAACGIVLFFVSSLARASRRNVGMLRILLIALAGLLLIGVLFKDAVGRLI